MLNLTQHNATTTQQEAGVRDLPDPIREELKKLLSFEEICSTQELISRAETIAALAVGAASIMEEESLSAMIGGAPFFMGPLTLALRRQGFQVSFAFSRRESVEEVQEDGSVKKRTVFKHLGFQPAAPAAWCTGAVLEGCGEPLEVDSLCDFCAEEEVIDY